MSIKIPPPEKSSLAAANVPCQSSTFFRGASSNSVAHLISLLQPPFGFDFKWKMITQIATAIFDLGKDKRSLSMASHYRVTDNAAPQTPPPPTGRCRNLPTAVIEATCGYQLGHEILSHVLGKRNAHKPVSCTGGGLDLIPHGQHALSAGGRSSRSVHGTSYSFVQLADCEKKIRALWL